ncbi:MAG: signal peptidase II [Clostridia bacterium]|nr:signal peptidase II [Clostridia bacterium]MBQ5814076.1 signal peptidase II [Clostridia bacterium]
MIYFISAALMIIVDQLIKYWAVTELAPIGNINIIKGFFHLTYVENSGAAFSMLEGKQTFFIIITFAAFFLFYYIYKTGIVSGRLANWAGTFVAGGAIGNFIDRLRLGYVIDMFNFELIDFPVFNFADICITIGGALFVLIIWFDYLRERREKKAAAEKTAGEDA